MEQQLQSMAMLLRSPVPPPTGLRMPPVPPNHANRADSANHANTTLHANINNINGPGAHDHANYSLDEPDDATYPPNTCPNGSWVEGLEVEPRG